MMWHNLKKYQESFGLIIILIGFEAVAATTSESDIATEANGQFPSTSTDTDDLITDLLDLESTDFSTLGIPTLSLPPSSNARNIAYADYPTTAASEDLTITAEQLLLTHSFFGIPPTDEQTFDSTSPQTAPVMYTSRPTATDSLQLTADSCPVGSACELLLSMPTLSLPPPTAAAPLLLVTAPHSCPMDTACEQLLPLPTLSPSPPPSAVPTTASTTNCPSTTTTKLPPLPSSPITPPLCLTTADPTPEPEPTGVNFLISLPPLSLPPSRSSKTTTSHSEILLPLPSLSLPPYLGPATKPNPTAKPPLLPLPPLNFPPTDGPTLTESRSDATVLLLPIPPLTLPPAIKSKFSLTDAVTPLPFVPLPPLTLPPVFRPSNVTTFHPVHNPAKILPLPPLTLPPSFKSNSSIVTALPFLPLPSLTLPPIIPTSHRVDARMILPLPLLMLPPSLKPDGQPATTKVSILPLAPLTLPPEISPSDTTLYSVPTQPILPLPLVSLPPTFKFKMQPPTTVPLLPLAPVTLPPEITQSTETAFHPSVPTQPILPVPLLTLPPTFKLKVPVPTTVPFLPLEPLTLSPEIKLSNITTALPVPTEPILPLPLLTLPPTFKSDVRFLQQSETTTFLPLSPVTLPPIMKPSNITISQPFISPSLLPLPLITLPPNFKSTNSIFLESLTSPFLPLPLVTLSPTKKPEIAITTSFPVIVGSTAVLPTTDLPLLPLPLLNQPPSTPLKEASTTGVTTTILTTSDLLPTSDTSSTRDLKTTSSPITSYWTVGTTNRVSTNGLTPTIPLTETPDPTTTHTTTEHSTSSTIEDTTSIDSHAIVTSEAATIDSTLSTDAGTTPQSTTTATNTVAVTTTTTTTLDATTSYGPSFDSTTSSHVSSTLTFDATTTRQITTTPPTTTTTTRSTTTTTASTTTTTTPIPADNSPITTITQMSFEMTLDTDNCSTELQVIYSTEYNETFEIFKSIIFSVGEYIDLTIIGVVRLNFSCGSIIGAGTMQLPGTTTSNAAQISNKFSQVIDEKPPAIPVIQQYNVAEVNVLDVDECRTGQHDCHRRYGRCTNEDPGFTCACRSGYVELNPDNPGKSCKALCQINGNPYCLNGGSCTNGTGAADPTCNCTLPFFGGRCQYDNTPVAKEETTTYESTTNATLNTTIIFNATTPYPTTPNSTIMSSTMTSGPDVTSNFVIQNITFVTESMNNTDVVATTETFLSIAVTCSVTQNIDVYTFPSTNPGSRSYSEELCENQEGSKASIFCSNVNTYDPTSLQESKCKTIDSILNEPYTAQTMLNLEFATANISTLTNEKVLNISNFLFIIARDKTAFSATEVEGAAEIYSHLTEHYLKSSLSENEYSDERQNLVISLSKIARKLNYTSILFSIRAKDINIEVYEPSSIDLPYQFETNFTRNDNVTTRIAAKSRVSSLRIVALGFRSSVLFPSKRTTDWVISVSLGNSSESIDGISLAEPILIQSNDVEEPSENQTSQFKKTVTTLDCVFWDFESSDWSEDGCSMQPGVPATCLCNHLTNFAILVSRTELPADVALGVLTYVGCSLSIAGLVFTFVIICSSRVMRRKYQMRILGNICLCLTVALSLFIFGVDSQVDTFNCSILAAFMQYFFLATWFWTAVYSYTIYRDIVQVIRSYNRGFKIHYAALFAYGVPLVIVLLNASITLGHIDRIGSDEEFAESAYRARNFCWLRHFSLYFGFLVPVGLLLLLNIGIFCVVVPKVTCRQKQIQSSKAKRHASQNFAVCLSLATTMGFSWVFGYLMLISDNAIFLMTMSWLFTIVNSFQGVLIFYFATIRTGELRRLYAPVSQLFSSAQILSTGVTSETKSQDSSSRNPVSSIA